MNTLRISGKHAGFWETDVRAYITTMRPYLMFVSGITGITGMAFNQGINPLKALVIAIGSFLSYGFGQALTDCFQIDTDSISAPYRPLTRGIISKRFVALVSLTGLIVCVGLLAYWNPVNWILGITCGAGLVTYTWFKRRWWGGPFYNGWIVTVLCIMGFAAVNTGWARMHSMAFIAALVAVLFGYSNFVLAGYFKDIQADRATGYRTLPVVAGRKTAAVVSDCIAGIAAFAAIAACSEILIPESGLFTVIAAVVFEAAGLIAAIIGQVRLHGVENDMTAHRAITPGLLSYLFLLSGIVVACQIGWFIPLVIFCTAFFIVLEKRPFRNQI